MVSSIVKVFGCRAWQEATRCRTRWIWRNWRRVYVTRIPKQEYQWPHDYFFLLINYQCTRVPGFIRFISAANYYQRTKKVSLLVSRRNDNRSLAVWVRNRFIWRHTGWRTTSENPTKSLKVHPTNQKEQICRNRRTQRLWIVHLIDAASDLRSYPQVPRSVTLKRIGGWVGDLDIYLFHFQFPTSNKVSV